MRSKPLAAGLAMLGMAATPVAVALATEPDPPAPVAAGLGAQLNGQPTAAAEMRDAAQRLRDQRKRAHARAERHAMAAVSPTLKAIAQCESHGDPRAIGGGGAYRGLLQFDRGTWASVGGKGDPAAASPAEQYKRGAILYARSGAGQWPVCGR